MFLGDFFDFSKLISSQIQSLQKTLYEALFGIEQHQKRKIFKGEFVFEIF